MTKLGRRIEARRLTLTGVSVVVALATAVGAGARDYPAQTAGDWSIATSRDQRGCFLTKAYDRPGGTTLLLGLDIDGANRLTVLNDNWSIAPKDRLRLTFRLSNASFPKHFAVGIASGDRKGFVTSFGGKFPDHFAASRSLAVFRGEVPVERLSLDGSGAAVARLRDCVQALRTRPAAAAGQDAESGSIPRDPFARGATDRK